MDWLYKLIFRTCPAKVALVLKKIVRVRRRLVLTKRNLSFWIDPVTQFGRQILDTGTYEPELCEFLSLVLRPSDVFLDIGANEGFFSVLGAKLVDCGKVLSVEPQSRLIPILQKNIAANGLTNVQVLNTALGDREGCVTLFLSPDINSGSSSVRRLRRGVSEKVKCMTLDRLAAQCFLKKIRLVKLDCEGAEYDILKGARKLLDNHRIDFLIVDYHENIVGRDTVAGLDRFVRDAGYQLSRVANGIWSYHLAGLETELARMGLVQPVEPIPAFKQAVGGSV